MRHESPFIGRFLASAATAPFLRMKHSSTAGKVEVAGDEAWIGEAELRAYADAEPMTLYDAKAPGTHTFISSNAIAIGADVSTVAGGKVQTGTGGALTIGKAMSATSGDGEQIEVYVDWMAIANSLAIIAAA